MRKIKEEFARYYNTVSRKNKVRKEKYFDIGVLISSTDLMYHCEYLVFREIISTIM